MSSSEKTAVGSMVAALYVETGGCYFDVPGVVPVGHGEDHADGSTTVHRDGREYAGPYPVVAHPSCKRWGRFWHGSTRKPHQFKLGDDGGCFEHALNSVRAYGGVIEHPCDSKAWELFNLNPPPRSGGWVRADLVGGWTCCVDQSHYGHFANKLTWLYVFGVEADDLPNLIWGKGEQKLHPTALARLREGPPHRNDGDGRWEGQGSHPQPYPGALPRSLAEYRPRFCPSPRPDPRIRRSKIMTPTPTQALEPVEVTQADRELYLALGVFHTCEDKAILEWGWADSSTEMQAIARHRQSSNAASVVGRMGTALDVADRLIERGYGIDVPQEWHDEMREVAEARASLSTATAEPMGGDDGEHLHAMHATPPSTSAEAREIMARAFEPQFPVEAEKARKGLHFMLPSSWAVDAIHSALSHTPLSDLHPLGQEYDGDALREALAPFAAKVDLVDDHYEADYCPDWSPFIPVSAYRNAARALSATPPAQEEGRSQQEMIREIFVERICLDVAELPDRSSPDDWPDAMLVTAEELALIINTALDETDLATPAPTVDETDRLRGIVSGLRGALEHLENANEALASKRSRATYLAMEAEARDELIMLDEARRNARAALSDRPQAEGEPG